MLREEIIKIAESYGEKISIGTLGGHSALDVCRGAKDEGLKTVVVCKKGRERTYSEHYRAYSEPKNLVKIPDSERYKSSKSKGIVDEVIIVDDFSDIVKEDVQGALRDLNAVFVHSRYFWAYCDFDEIENNFKVPIFGTRSLVRKEERSETKNQYYLLKKAGIPVPKQFQNPKEIDRLVLVKTPEAERDYERAFFFAKSPEDYAVRSEKLLKSKTITEEGLRNAVIEEFVSGAQVNFNFFYSPLSKKVELLGTDVRRQTNLDGILRLPAEEQKELLKYEKVRHVETGHIAVTVKESLLENAYDCAERFVKATQETYPPGIIGPFALQGAISCKDAKEDFVVFDVSMRIPGSPGTRYTPYANYLYGEDVSAGRRIAMEIKEACKKGKLQELVT